MIPVTVSHTPWNIAIRYYPELGTWMFTLIRKDKEDGLEYYPEYWESKDEAAEVMEDINRKEGLS